MKINSIKFKDGNEYQIVTVDQFHEAVAKVSGKALTKKDVRAWAIKYGFGSRSGYGFRFIVTVKLSQINEYTQDIRDIGADSVVFDIGEVSMEIAHQTLETEKELQLAEESFTAAMRAVAALRSLLADAELIIIPVSELI